MSCRACGCTLNGCVHLRPVPTGSRTSRVRLRAGASDATAKPADNPPRAPRRPARASRCAVVGALYGKACVGRRRPGGATKMPRNVSCEQNPPSITARTSNDSYATTARPGPPMHQHTISKYLSMTPHQERLVMRGPRTRERITWSTVIRLFDPAKHTS